MTRGRWTAALGLLGVLLLAGCGVEPDPASPDAGRPTRGLGEGCTSSEDCRSTLCLEVAPGRAICTETCSDDRSCPAGGWGCVRPEGFPASVCGCSATDAVEVCGDGLDNDCNGRSDDCRICGGRPVAMDDPANCGACGNACRSDEECHEGDCRCIEASEIECAGRCVDRASDPSNCGSCGNICGAGRVCALGACTCPAGTSECGSICAETDTSRLHCGTCDHACVDTETCVLGACTCPTGQTLCGGRCVSTSSSASHCGACGNACRADEECSAGACACASGEECGGVCLDTTTDLANCGGCGRACASGERCEAGTCRCDSGLHCSGRCVPPADPANCGACGSTCSAATVCDGRSCVCPSFGQLECGGTCTDPRTDAENCGACGNVCDPATVCLSGVCDCPVSTESLCSGVGCVSLTNDRANCGACGAACAPLQVCAGARCSCPASTPNLCGSLGCVDFRTDELHCGSCINECRPGEECSSYSCRCPTLGALWCASAGACIDTLSDPANCGACGRACPSDAACSSGVCRCGAPGETVCGADCVDLMTDAGHCGTCTRSCTGPQVCGAGVCTCAPAVASPDVRITTAAGDSNEVRVAWNGSTALVVWTDRRDVSGRTTIWGQLVDADGTLSGAEFQISPSVSYPYSPDSPDVVWNGTEWGVSYQEYRSGGGAVHLARLAADGTPLAAPTTLVWAHWSNLYLGYNSTVGYLVVAASSEIYFRSLGPDGTTPGTAVRVYSTGCCPEGIIESDMAVSPTGEIAIIHSQQAEVILDRLTPSGGLGSGSRYTLTTRASLGRATTIEHDGSTWVAAWYEYSGSSTERIVAARGDALATRFTASTTTGYALVERARLAVRGRELVVTWQARATTTSQWHIDGRRLLLPLTTTGALSALEAATTRYVTSTTIEEDTRALHGLVATPIGLLFAWSDTRWGQTEIYEQAVTLPACAP